MMVGQTTSGGQDVTGGRRREYVILRFNGSEQFALFVHFGVACRDVFSRAGTIKPEAIRRSYDLDDGSSGDYHRVRDFEPVPRC